MTALEQRVLDALADGPARLAGIVTRVHAHRFGVRDALLRLRARGDIEQTRPGGHTWRLANRKGRAS